MAEKPNNNCLRGAKCPKCGSFGDFRTVVSSTMRVSDDGTEELGGDTEFEDDAWAQCCECEHQGKWWDFQEENHGKTKPAPKVLSAEKQIEDLLETGKFADSSADNILAEVSKRFNRICLSFGRSDADDELGRKLTDAEWETIRKTAAWPKIYSRMVDSGFAGINEALKEAGLT